MDVIAKDRVLKNWKQKLVAVFIATMIWLLVNHSITSTKIVAGIPVRIVNLSAERAADGLLPNGILNKRLTLTLTGTKETIEHIEPGDLEVVLDATNAPDEWVVQITKKDLVSLNPDIDVSRDITQISQSEFIIDLDKMMTAKIPVTILSPTGKAPSGYEYLGTWPKQLMQSVTGPKLVIQQLHAKGLELSFDLNEISKEELDAIHTTKSAHNSDEVSYKIPDIWKKISIPLLTRPLQPLNDLRADNLHMDFLRKEYISLNRNIPIQIFYPMENISNINPIRYPLKKSSLIDEVYGTSVLNAPLLAYGVSRLFVDTVKDHLEIVITAKADENNTLPWSLEFVDQESLENTFVSLLKETQIASENLNGTEQRENQWRGCFGDYMKKMTLFLAKDRPLILKNTLEPNGISVEQK